MRRLIAFGCSMTYGQSMPDNYMDHDSLTPSKFAWPEILGKLTGTEVVNMATCGASNKEILHLILEYQFESTDIIMVCWTFTDRTCIITNEKLLRLGVWYLSPIKGGRSDVPALKKRTAAYYAEVWDEHDSSLSQHRCIHYANLYLNSKNLKNYHLTVNNDLIHEHPFFNTPMLPVDYMSIIQDPRNPKALDNDHPGEQTHRRLAEKLWHLTLGLTNG